ncbi:hypothetical protein [Sporosarcina ureae]|uniref:Uncharacterized protein n=1 Tax=Sporosarcina ureae TaxID=1571 RepID=A0ABM6JXA1_SPOUR|nr:hypothetical protein [Sporosarcina ureae]ARF14717.1 hypothetical protein SporoS204_11510 [Sporosarcina ureae]
MLKGKVNTKRKTIETISFGVVILSNVIGIVLFNSKVGEQLTYNTIWSVIFTGLAIAMILLLISRLIPKEN